MSVIKAWHRYFFVSYPMSANKFKKIAKTEFVDVQTQYPVFMSLDFMYTSVRDVHTVQGTHNTRKNVWGHRLRGIRGTLCTVHTIVFTETMQPPKWEGEIRHTVYFFHSFADIFYCRIAHIHLCTWIYVNISFLVLWLNKYVFSFDGNYGCYTEYQRKILWRHHAR